MTSVVAFPSRFTKIDELTRPDHYWLTEEDQCFYLGEYTARQGYAYSATNNLILNFKKALDRRHKREWRYKELAIQQAAAAFRNALGTEPTATLMFVPVPPSRGRKDPLHDDRVTRMLRAMWSGQAVDVREIVVQEESTDAAHEALARPTPQQIAAGYRIDGALAIPKPAVIAIVDDVLTTGAHFRAASTVLTARFPAAQVFGLFITRRVPDADLPF